MSHSPQYLAGPDVLETVIDSLGSGGDGMADRIAIPRTLPGERVHARKSAGNHARLLDLLSESPERVAPACPHFAAYCGGCALQHLEDAAYATWKSRRLAHALASAGFAAAPLAALVRTPAGGRRRIDFALRRTADGVSLGLHEAHGAGIIDIRTCPILHQTLQTLLAPLRDLANSLAALGRTGSVVINLLDSGPDLLLRTDRALTPPDRTRLAAFATAHSLPRIGWAQNDQAPQIAVQVAPAYVTFSGRRVVPPPGAFLQASAEGQGAIVDAVMAAVPEKRTRKTLAIELYAGIGTLSFPLGGKLRVLAYEGDMEAAAALRRAQSGSHVEATERDLARQPLSVKELLQAALVVLDPPYGGAGPQMPALASCGVDTIVYVSCNPSALAKDAALLGRAGYIVDKAVPIDQFLWSAHLESVVTFRKMRAER